MPAFERHKKHRSNMNNSGGRRNYSYLWTQREKRGAGGIRQSTQRLGQHFLISKTVPAKMMTAANIQPDEVILEVGPGMGVLTRELAARAQWVIAVEKDGGMVNRLAAALKQRGIHNVTLVHGDILKCFPDRLALPKTYRVIANIPYYLTSRLIRTFLTSHHQPEDMLLMIQKEVAERILAQPPNMNLLALSVQAYAEPKTLFTIPRSAFSPAPAVESAVIHLKEISDQFFRARNIEPEKFFELVHAGFHARRKTIVNNLDKYFGSKRTAAEALKRAAIDGGRRAETLSLEEWAGLVQLPLGAEKSGQQPMRGSRGGGGE